MSTEQKAPTEASKEDESKPRLSGRAKAVLATVGAIVSLTTGLLTLGDRFLSDDDPEPTPNASSNADTSNTVADISNDAEAKSRALRVSDTLKECAEIRGGYDSCNTGGILGALRVPIGSGVGAVEVDVSSPASYELTSRSESGNVFRLENTVQGEAVRTCTPRASGGCPQDGTW